MLAVFRIQSVNVYYARQWPLRTHQHPGLVLPLTSPQLQGCSGSFYSHGNDLSSVEPHQTHTAYSFQFHLPNKPNHTLCTMLLRKSKETMVLRTFWGWRRFLRQLRGFCPGLFR